MNDLVLAAKALADPTRVRVLAALRDGELCVCELSDALEVTQSTLSTHLQVIREADLVQTRKEGKWVYYALKPEAKRLLKGVFSFFAEALAKGLGRKPDGDENEYLRKVAGIFAKAKEAQGILVNDFATLGFSVSRGLVSGRSTWPCRG